MQNCNLSRSLQFLRLETHLTSVVDPEMIGVV